MAAERNSGSKSTGTKRSTASKAAETRARNKAQEAERLEQLRKERRIHDEIIAIILIAVGIFLVISLMTKTTGALGAAVQGVLFGCFGKVCSYILSGFLIVYGILIFAEKASFITLRSVLCMVCMFLLTSCLSTPLDTIPEKFTAAVIPELYAAGAEGGGVVGTLLAMLLVRLTGTAGYYLISIAGIIVTIIATDRNNLSNFFAIRCSFLPLNIYTLSLLPVNC